MRVILSAALREADDTPERERAFDNFVVASFRGGELKGALGMALKNFHNERGSGKRMAYFGAASRRSAASEPRRANMPRVRIGSRDVLRGYPAERIR
jgi:hypothetical protein